MYKFAVIQHAENLLHLGDWFLKNHLVRLIIIQVSFIDESVFLSRYQANPLLFFNQMLIISCSFQKLSFTYIRRQTAQALHTGSACDVAV